MYGCFARKSHRSSCAGCLGALVQPYLHSQPHATHEFIVLVRISAKGHAFNPCDVFCTELLDQCGNSVVFDRTHFLTYQQSKVPNSPHIKERYQTHKILHSKIFHLRSFIGMPCTMGICVLCGSRAAGGADGDMTWNVGLDG